MCEKKPFEQRGVDLSKETLVLLMPSEVRESFTAMFHDITSRHDLKEVARIADMISAAKDIESRELALILAILIKPPDDETIRNIYTPVFRLLSEEDTGNNANWWGKLALQMFANNPGDWYGGENSGLERKEDNDAGK